MIEMNLRKERKCHAKRVIVFLLMLLLVLVLVLVCIWYFFLSQLVLAKILYNGTTLFMVCLLLFTVCVFFYSITICVLYLIKSNLDRFGKLILSQKRLSEYIKIKRESMNVALKAKRFFLTFLLLIPMI